MRIVIIEDEVLAQKELIKLLEEVDAGVEVVSCLRSVAQGIKWLASNNGRYDLLFADIELLDGQSFEIFQQLSIDTPVIFLTAYDEYAIQSFKVNSIDYLLKPVEPRGLKNALDKFSRLNERRLNISLDDLQALIHSKNKPYKERFNVKIGDIYRYIATKDIAYFYSDDKATYLVTHEKDHLIIGQSLNDLEVKLDPSLFFRVSRKYLVHIHAVEKASKYFNSRLKLKLIPVSEEEVLVSRVKVPGFLEWMGQG